jgi:hypothetical protein
LGIPCWCNHAVKIGTYANKDNNKDGFVDVKDDVTKFPAGKYEREIDKLGNELPRPMASDGHPRTKTVESAQSSGFWTAGRCAYKP